MTRRLISIVIPVSNEAENIPLLYRALREVWEKLSYDYEFIFVDDGSHDNSVAVVETIASLDSKVRCIEFSRNFGKEMATTAGLDAATGDAVIIIDSDMQHPPELIPALIARWEKGAEVVVGVRTSNSGEGFAKKAGSWLFYSVMRLVSETAMEQGETDFRLLDRAVVDAFKRLPERGRMTRTLINWLGFRKELVRFEAHARVHGSAQYSTRKLVQLGLHSLVSNSLLPLKLAGYLGVIIASLSGILGTAVLIEKYILHDAWGWGVSGSAQLALINVFLVGIVLMALGLIALYIAGIHVEVAGRPLYVVRKKVNF